VTVSIAEP